LMDNNVTDVTGKYPLRGNGAYLVPKTLADRRL
jgi:hypothetical protein